MFVVSVVWFGWDFDDGLDVGGLLWWVYGGNGCGDFCFVVVVFVVWVGYYF